MRITLNGRPHDVPDGTRVADLIRSLELTAERVAVELNRELVARARHGETVLAEGDAVEVVTLVGGG